MDLPLFPLHLVLYPGRPLPLHLFEQRYRQMLRDCLDGDGVFGVVAIRAGREVGQEWRTDAQPDAGPDARFDDARLDGADDARGDGVEELIHQVGTVAEITTVSERRDGRFDITTRGVSRFRIIDPRHDRPYLHADVEPLEEGVGAGDAAAAAALREVLIPYLREMGVPEELFDRLPEDPGELSYLASSALQVEVPVQQRLLELPTHAARMEEAVRIIRRESGIMRRFGVTGSFRPPGPGGAQLN